MKNRPVVVLALFVVVFVVSFLVFYYTKYGKKNSHKVDPTFMNVVSILYYKHSIPFSKLTVTKFIWANTSSNYIVFFVYENERGDNPLKAVFLNYNEDRSFTVNDCYELDSEYPRDKFLGLDCEVGDGYKIAANECNSPLDLKLDSYENSTEFKLITPPKLIHKQFSNRQDALLRGHRAVFTGNRYELSDLPWYLFNNEVGVMVDFVEDDVEVTTITVFLELIVNEKLPIWIYFEGDKTKYYFDRFQILKRINEKYEHVRAYKMNKVSVTVQTKTETSIANVFVELPKFDSKVLVLGIKDKFDNRHVDVSITYALQVDRYSILSEKEIDIYKNWWIEKVDPTEKLFLFNKKRMSYF